MGEGGPPGGVTVKGQVWRWPGVRNGREHMARSGLTPKMHVCVEGLVGKVMGALKSSENKGSAVRVTLTFKLRRHFIQYNAPI